MKTIKRLLIPATFVVTFICASCSSAPSEPTVTYKETFVTGTPYPNFGATQTYYTLYDNNRLCSKNSGQVFKVTKTTQIINSADRCDKCGRCWYAHDKK